VGIVLAGFIALLVFRNYLAQMELQDSALKNFRQELDKNATVLSYFYYERRNDIRHLPAIRDLNLYFDNKARGISRENGARAGLRAVRQGFDTILEECKLGGDRIYTRLVFIDHTGVCLVDSQEASGGKGNGSTWRRFLTPANSEPVILVERWDDQPQVMVSHPYFFQGEYAGQIVAWISAPLIHKRLAQKFSQDYLRVFCREGNFCLDEASPPFNFLPDLGKVGDEDFFSFNAPLEDKNPMELIGAKVMIQATPLFLVGLLPAKDLFGHMDPRYLLVALGSLSALFLLGLAVLWHTNTHNLILYNRLEEAAIREQEIEKKNQQLQEEIAERQRADAALRAAEEKYRSIYENAVDGIFQSTPEGRFINVNPAMARMYGYESPQELITQITDIGRQFYVNPLRRGDFQRWMDRSGYVKGFEYQVYRKDGSAIWISESARAVRNDQGDIIYYEGFMQDITERKEAEELSRHLIVGSPVGIYIIQSQRFQLVNQLFYEITGFGPDEAGKIDPWGLVYPDDRENVRKEALNMLRGKTSTPYEYRILTKDGEIKWILETVTSTQYQGKRATLGFFMDVSEHRELEKKFVQAQKMEAVGRLAGGLAHDFSNMLAVIMWYATLLAKNLHKEDPIYAHAEGIKKAANQAGSLIRQILAFSRKQMLQPQVTNLNVIVANIEKMLKRLIGEDIEMVLFLDAAAEDVKVDPGQMEQVLMNLAVNARDAMPLGGKLTIETGNVFLDHAYTQKHPYVEPGHHVMLAVSDNGMGMDGETRARVFEPFFTTKEAGKGTGLGLSTVYGIVKQSGGAVEVYSEPGQGTTFKVYLPAVSAAAAAEASKPATAEHVPLRGTETLLLVEDEALLRGPVADTLRFYGYRVLEAGDGREALLISERHQGPIHLMLTDVVMPQMSGRELAERLGPLRPEMKVLFMSGYTEDAIVHHGVLESAMPYIQKPFTPESLVGKIREALDSPSK
jgi:PAS domain S-box-containing protein